MVSIPEAQDDFFAGQSGIVGTFDYDYDRIIDFKTQVGMAALCCIPGALCVSSVFCYPCFLKQNIEWDTRARHLALTIDGIRFVHDKRKFLCGCECSDKGKETKTIPYDQITDCDVLEPAGTAFCCFIPRVLHTVTVDTASSGGVSDKNGSIMHELVLEGLKEPHAFKQAVWSLKRGQLPSGARASLIDATASTGASGAPKQMDMSTALLTDIRDELRKLNTLMAESYGATK
eukprot:TRINITY_DN8689_c0_g1_i1.p1 TRINITY_DN8689_c0_g1~~TRINITY_DN8689_c0_g1_i1.p1  ORF type:complete len:232 (+),score=39.12 TRINITY_DN8689_c0_g1_i1:116-811(+)